MFMYYYFYMELIIGIVFLLLDSELECVIGVQLM